VAMIDGVLRII